MSDESAFLQAVLEHPDDDTPRLMFADWLMERGDPRGEFIRVQCELARLPMDDERRFDLIDRERDLFAEHGEKWAKPICSIVSTYEFRRGFVDTVGLGPRSFLKDGKKVFDRAPVRRLRLVRLASSNIKGNELSEQPLLARLQSLELPGCVRAPDLLALLRSPHLTGLRALSLPELELRMRGDRDVVEALLEGRMPHLEELDLSRHVLGRDVLPLANAPPFPLRKLNLTGNNLDRNSAEELANAPGLAGLTHLNLSENQIQLPGGQALARSPYLTKLVSLQLRGGKIGVGGTRALAESPNAEHLMTLDLDDNNIADSGAKAIAASPHLGRLTELHLGMNKLGVESARALAAWPGLGRLTVLNLFINHDIGEEGARLLAASPHLGRLRHLNLGYTDIGNRGTAALVASPYLAQLRSLNLQGTKLGDAGVTLLARSPHFARLRQLNLANNDIRDMGVRALVESPHLTQLRSVKVSQDRLSAGVKKALEQRFR